MMTARPILDAVPARADTIGEPLDRPAAPGVHRAEGRRQAAPGLADLAIPRCHLRRYCAVCDF
jgi:hypothetical protein